MAPLVFHLPAAWIGLEGQGLLPFYRKIFQGLTEQGIAFAQVAIDRETALAQIEGNSAFHILNHGQITHPRALNAGIAYIYPFWNLDPKGIRAFSSIADKPFRPGKIDAEKARAFHRRLHDRLVKTRQSRYEQPQEAEALPKAAAAVFFQSESHRIVGETLYLDRWTMLDAVIAATAPAPVIVKPHPREMSTETFDRLLDVQKRHPQLHISLGNIHDIIAASDRVVTINSAVGVEAYLHGTPVILCGRTDFHHIATIAQSRENLIDALTHEAPKRAYAKYLYWYFGQECLNAGAANLTDRFLHRIRATGFDI